MKTGKTSTRFEFKIEDDVLDDYEFLEVLSEVDRGDYGKVTEMVDMLLGTEQKEKLKEHVRNENGKVSASQIMNEVKDIFEASNEIKN